MRIALILATHNSHKVTELKHSLSDCEIFGLKDLEALDGTSISWDETSDTFKGNATIKTRATLSVVQRHSAKLPPGLFVLADDSGLEVDALDGAPGVHSSDFAGTHFASQKERDRANCTKLKEVLSAKQGPFPARFVCHLMLTHAAGGTPNFFSGTCEGEIRLEAKGTEGFGYDPMFFVPSHGKMLAELSLAEKNQLSHRAQAVAKLRAHLLNGA